MDKNCVIKTEHLKKEYRLGVIGTGTLRNDIQSWIAKKRGKEDPNSRIGSKQYEAGERFLALDDINLEILRGERVGIIGANGAGKIHAAKAFVAHNLAHRRQHCLPRKDRQYARGRHGLSCRAYGQGEHIPQRRHPRNDKSEVDKKIDEIIEFSECEKFIDTPVKRYSSGMFVKLAFSVASHLDAEIMIMDEVLAVGDMKFQRKCISKMRELAVDHNRTVLYVSHNMGTIQDLCNRCIVLDHGKKVYDGDVDEAIKLYMGGENDEFFSYEYVDDTIKNPVKRHDLNLKSVKYNGRTTNLFYDKEPLSLSLGGRILEDIPSLSLRIEVQDARRIPITSYIIEDFYSGKKGETHSEQFTIDVSKIAGGRYFTRYIFFNRKNENVAYDDIEDAAGLTFRHKYSETNKRRWNRLWGSIRLGNIGLLGKKE